MADPKPLVEMARELAIKVAVRALSPLGGQPLPFDVAIEMASANVATRILPSILALLERVAGEATADFDLAAGGMAIQTLRVLKLEAQLAAAQKEIERLKEVQADELGTNLRIAERLGFWKQIEGGMSYEDAEVAAFDALRERAEKAEADLAVSQDALDAEGSAASEARAAQRKADSGRDRAQEQLAKALEIIRDIDRHATPIGGSGVPDYYAVTVGSIHRALALVGGQAKCADLACPRSLVGARPGEGTLDLHPDDLVREATQPQAEQLYPCVECGLMRTKAEGGTTFTVCDGCWEKHYRVEVQEERKGEVRMKKTILMLLVSLFAATSSATVLPHQPHILFVMADDLDLGAQGSLNNDVSNPVPDIKALKTGGIEFVRAVVLNTVCGPSRSTWLTGQQSFNHGVNCNGAATTTDGTCVNGSTAGFWNLIDPTNTVNKWVQAAGYKTGVFGKPPNGYGIDTTGSYPSTDVRSPLYVGPYWDNWTALVGHSTYLSYGFTLNENGTLTTYPATAPNHQTRVLGGKAASWIAANHSGGPLMVYLAPVAPHFTYDFTLGPNTGDYSDIWDVANLPDIGVDPVIHPVQWTATQALAFWIAGKNSFNVNNPISGYSHLAMTPTDISQAQSQFRLRAGAMLAVNDVVKAAVAAFGTDPVIVFFTSDNGYSLGEKRKGGKQGALNEDAFVPLYARLYNATVPFVGQRQELVTNADMASTLTEIAGGVVGRVQDGRSLVPLLNGLSPAWRKRVLISHEQLAVVGSVPDLPRYRAVRTGPTDALPGRLLIDWPLTGECELYDGKMADGVTADPWQTVNKCATSLAEKATLLGYLTGLNGCVGVGCGIAEGF